MMITTTIFALSMLLFVGYTMGMGYILNRCRASSTNAGQPLDEAFELQVQEYHTNVKKLKTMTAAIGALTVISFFVV